MYYFYNALGLVRNINFYDTDNELEVDLSPQDIKDTYDAKSLIPTLESYFSLHPNFTYDYFLGDEGIEMWPYKKYYNSSQLPF